MRTSCYSTVDKLMLQVALKKLELFSAFVKIMVKTLKDRRKNNALILSKFNNNKFLAGVISKSFPLKLIGYAFNLTHASVGTLPASIFLFKMNNRTLRKRLKIFSKLTMNTLERRHCRKRQYRSYILICIYAEISLKERNCIKLSRKIQVW